MPPNALSSETNNKLHKAANILILWNINETKIRNHIMKWYKKCLLFD